MKISANLDLDVVALEQPDELTLLVELVAPTVISDVARPPATLQIVLDRSGSMAGERLTGAKAALLSLIDRLEPTDNLGIVAFDDSVAIVVPNGPLTDKAAVKHAIASIHSGGSTDLAAGYLRGLQEARRAAGDTGATLLLISDGHANRGVQDPVRLGKVASQAHTNGVTTSTLGFGLGYDERLLAALARGGAGNELFAEEADAAGVLIAGEAEGLLEQVAQAASLVIRMEHAVEGVTVLNQLPTVSIEGGVMAELGTFYGGETRKLVLRFDVPGIASLGLAQIATLELTHVSLPDLVQHTVSLPVHVNVVPGDQAAGRVPDPIVRAEALYQRTQDAKRRSSELLSEGRTGEALLLLNETSAGLHAMADSMPDAYYTDELRQEASLMADMVSETEAGFVARAAKTGSYDSARKSRNRGRRNTTTGVVLRWADGSDEDGAGILALEEWQIQRLRRVSPEIAEALAAPHATVYDEIAADALVQLIDPGHPLHVFLLEATTHGGFVVGRN